MTVNSSVLNFRFPVRSVNWRNPCWSSDPHEELLLSHWRNWRSMFSKFTNVQSVASQQRTSCSSTNTFPSTNQTALPTSAGNVASAIPPMSPFPDISSSCTSWRNLSLSQNRMDPGRTVSRKTSPAGRRRPLMTLCLTENAKYVQRPLKRKLP